MGMKSITLSQHDMIVREIIKERDELARQLVMASKQNDILDRIREAKRGPLENYVGHVLDDAAAEIERLRAGRERLDPDGPGEGGRTKFT